MRARGATGTRSRMSGGGFMSYVCCAGGLGGHRQSGKGAGGCLFLGRNFPSLSHS